MANTIQFEEFSAAKKTSLVVERARAAGFDWCGIAPAAEFPELSRQGDWLDKGYAGEMKYLHDPRRRSPQLAMDGARSIIVCALNFNTAHPLSIDVAADISAATLNSGQSTPAGGPRGWISRYGWGDDYHIVLGEKLDAVVRSMKDEFTGPFEAKSYVDTGPIAERVAAKHSGLGWLAKNTCLINENLGSWLFLGVIITTLDLAPSVGPSESAPPDLCGNCTLCIDACPTEAIVEPYVLDARRCIAYLTIELRGTIPEELRKPMGHHIFGCDICQDVCPWNRRAPIVAPRNFEPRRVESNSGLQSLFAPEIEWLISLTDEEYRQIFRGSPVKRTKWRGLIRNCCVALGNSGLRQEDDRYAEICERLAVLAASDDTVIAEHARWALGQLGR